MAFLTKLDFSNNRQVKQYPETFTVLSGGTKFGLPFGDLVSGPDLTTSGITNTFTNLVSTFSGNTGTTVFTWYNSNMNLAYNTISAITPSNSATTQNTGLVFTANTTTTIDGNTVVLTYSGVSFDLVGLAMIELSSGVYSGSVHTNNLYYLSAGTLDYTGRTIWVDVSGITRTQDLIITDTPQIGYVWSCIDIEGKGAWTAISGVTGASSHWSGGSGTNAIVVKNSNSIATGNYSLAEGFQTTASGNYSHSLGNGTIASGENSFAGGKTSSATGTTSFVFGDSSKAFGNATIVLGNNITGSTNNYTYVESLNIKTVGSTASLNDLRIDANGNLTTNTSDVRLKENIKPISNALETIKNLNGVSYQWKDRSAGGNDIKFGFIAQDVNKVQPYLTFKNKSDGYMGLHVDGIIPFIVEAIKEMSSGETTNKNIYIETQKIIAEDNNIELNYNGNVDTAIGGGIKVLNAIDIDKSAEIITDKNGNWITNNDFKPFALTIPEYTPKSSNDINGNIGNITRDNDFFYIKTNNKWKRIKLEDF